MDSRESSSSRFSIEGPTYSPPTPPRRELVKEHPFDGGLFDGSFFGLSGSASSAVFNPTLESFALAFGSDLASPLLGASSSAPSSTNPFAFDQLLESPLGLNDSPSSSLMASPLFAASSAPASGSLTPLPFDDEEFSFSSLFPAADHSALATHLQSNPPPPPHDRSFDVSFLLDSFTSASPAPSAGVPSCSRSTSAAPSASGPSKRKPTGFKPEIPLLSADAPVQDRAYVLPSSTSRKRQPAVLAKELAKRQRKGEDVSALQSADGELSQDLLDVIEKKRLQNTLAARKSRARKQGRLEELEKENDELRAESEGLRERVRRMEALLDPLGLLLAV